MRNRFAPLLALAVIACATPHAVERGTHSPPPGTCLDNDLGRTYMASVWRALQDAWEIPRGVPPGQSVEVKLTFDASGDPGPGLVTEATHDRLAESVLEAIERVEFPPTPEPLRSCLAG